MAFPVPEVRQSGSAIDTGDRKHSNDPILGPVYKEDGDDEGGGMKVVKCVSGNHVM